MIYKKLIFNIKVSLFFTLFHKFPLWHLIQIWKISISLICMVNLCHMSRIAVWKHLTVDLEALLDKLRMIDGVKRLEVLGQV